MLKLLSEPSANPKIFKNTSKGILTAPLHLAPHTLSGYNVCPMASLGCIQACLNTAGRGGMFKAGEQSNSIQRARIRKTKMFFEQRELFFDYLRSDIEKLLRLSAKNSLSCGVRLNATSDIPWESYKPYENSSKSIFEIFPDVMFYDYTKRTNRTNIPKNYHLTFSLSEDNEKQAESMIKRGMNVAVVYSSKNFPVKDFIGMQRTKVINGDEHDFRPLDGTFKKGVIVGLKAKGKAKKNGTSTGFVRKTFE
jgi:hypothetical protein